MFQTIGFGFRYRMLVAEISDLLVKMEIKKVSEAGSCCPCTLLSWLLSPDGSTQEEVLLFFFVR